MVICFLSHAAKKEHNVKNARLLNKDQPHIATMFNRIAPVYDFLNHFLSAGWDYWWRRVATKAMARFFQNDGIRRYIVADIATGTGDLGFSFLKTLPSASIVGVDIAWEMLKRAQIKSIRNDLKYRYSPVQGDATSLPLRDSSCNGIMIAYGIRNVPNVNRVFEEFSRVLRPLGHILILEFGIPEQLLVRKPYLFYFNRLLPRIGGLISGNREAYTYLPVSVHHFMSPATMARFLADHGFTVLRIRRFLAGVSYFIIAQKSEGGSQWAQI